MSLGAYGAAEKNYEQHQQRERIRGQVREPKGARAQENTDQPADGPGRDAQGPQSIGRSQSRNVIRNIRPISKELVSTAPDQR